MSIGKIHTWKKVVAQIILLGVPTAALVFYVLLKANAANDILENNWLIQGCYFISGMLAAFVLYSYRFRFITTALALFGVFYVVKLVIDHFTFGEFDAFFASIRFIVFSILFSAGWIAGYGFSRSKYFTIFWSCLLLCAQVIIVSYTNDYSNIIRDFAPVLAYAFYIIFTAELIRNMNANEKYASFFIGKRMLGFAVVLLLLLWGIFSFFKEDFKAIEKEWGNAKAQYDEKNSGQSESMTQKNKDGSISNKDQTRLTGSLNRGKRLVFVAKLDNFFADGKTPNPLYFTAFYYTKFDTLTQTFERDAQIPDNDLFEPDPSKIPLYFAKTDSSVIKNTHATTDRKVVSAEVYKVLLAPDEYVAPSTSFFCQPIPVAPEYKEQYKSAYRAKMWVSDLNSAYFIYNPAGNKQLEDFQQVRFDALRQVNGFDNLDKKFKDYYTYMPTNPDYDSITALAKKITAQASTPIDKMLAIRSYFLSKDEFDQPLFKYTDNPGIPGLPSASKLNYFLFENRKGYCAYFAGATLFMLRSLGIPSRIAVGFLTVDRSSKNPGWYWFYEDQAHAWVQVYFPGYGWIDFDTTIPDVNTQQAPQPDETPPLNMQDAYFVADGTVTKVDTIKKQVELATKKILFHDKDFEADKTTDILLDVSIASITKDTGQVRLSDVKNGMHATAASYSETLKNILPADDDSMLSVISKLKQPIPVDELKIIDPESAAAKKQADQQQQQTTDWLQVMWVSLAVIGGLLLLIFSLPWFIWQYYHIKAKSRSTDRNSAYIKYRAAMYYLNQLNYPRSGLTPENYAASIDGKFNTNFSAFTRVYQKLKYSSLPLTQTEQQAINMFYPSVIQQVRKHIPFRKRFADFLNIYNTIAFFSNNKQA